MEWYYSNEVFSKKIIQNKKITLPKTKIAPILREEEIQEVVKYDMFGFLCGESYSEGNSLPFSGKNVGDNGCIGLISNSETLFKISKFNWWESNRGLSLG